MKKINIFLASSITEFAVERMEIENFIRNVSDEFEDKYNVKLKPFLCEHIDPAFSQGRKQEEYNEIIRDCDFCFFIFFTKVGEYTREEFDVARKQFEAAGKPKIYTYFKVVQDDCVEQSLYDFINMLDKQLGHYYSSFTHIDTVKLRILLSVKLQEMDFLEIKAEDGHCVVDGQHVLSLDNVAEFSNNQQLVAMQRKLAELEKTYFALKAQYHSHVGDAEFYSHYSRIASQRQTLMDEIAELQGLIFNLSMQMVKDDTHGDVSPRQKQAYRLFEQGDYEGCMAVLDAADIDSDFLAQRRRIQEQARKQEETVCRKYIREHKTAIDILMTMKKYEGRFAEIEQRYDTILPVIWEMGIELDTACKYVEYLYDQNKDAKALPIVEQLWERYTDDANKAKMLNRLSLLYGRLGKPEQEEKAILQAIAIHKVLAADNPGRFNPDLADSYYNAGVFYYKQDKPDKAEKYCRKAIAIREALAADNPDRFNHDLAGSYNNAGVFYYKQDNPNNAKEYYRKAIAIYEALAADNPDRFNPALAMSYHNAGALYIRQEQPNEADEYYRKAIAIFEALAADNPDRFNHAVALSYNNAGNFYYKLGNPDEAMEYYRKAIAIYEALAADNPDRYNPDLAGSYHNAGGFYKDQGQPDKAEEFYRQAIAIREALVADNPDRFNHALAGSYHNAGGFYKGQGQPDKAEEFYGKAIAIFEMLAANNPDRFNPDLAGSYHNAGVFYNDQGKPVKAEEYCRKAIAIYEALAADNPDRFNPALALSYHNAGFFYKDQGQPDKAEEFYSKAIVIYEALAADNPDRFNPDLADSYNNAGDFYKDQGQPDKAEEYFAKANALKR